ncbi:hypothetical protein MLD38_002478 [Melastoma candidum]|uniref:Uncharacterized protein n=1 Tax=Melastoma candidum TaxID=119954 RepID=A0ACB9S023_9MYRT|nr:hypothetical protein MLD38_002478 [Melastoma candidum]
MGSFPGIIQRPLVAAAAVAAASVTVDLPEKFSPSRASETCSTSHQLDSRASAPASELRTSWVTHITDSKLANLFFVTRIRVPLPEISHRVPYFRQSLIVNSLCPNAVPCSALLSPYRSAELVKGPKPSEFSSSASTSRSNPDVLYRWHLPEPSAVDISGSEDCSKLKHRMVVVLLGWLGAKQKHLKKYAEWYTSKGFNVITFTFPISEILSYQVGGKAEQDVGLLVKHLVEWLEDEDGRNLVFHTFSNTGWLTYGAILEKLQQQDPVLMGKIKGCVVDSAPVAAPDPQVWASGFSAAFLKKQSVATKGISRSTEKEETKPALTESALLLILEKLFEVVLKLPTVNRRLSDVLDVLSSRPPSCPQLYIYSSADRVIPADYVESFIEEQKRLGVEVRACNFVSTPHVDHFRNDPKLYTTQLTHFLEDYVLAGCRRASS